MIKRRKSKPVAERFAIKYIPEPNSGCWLWIGFAHKIRNELRPFINSNKKPTLAHRVSYELFKGPIPDGMIVRHKCDNTICVNPDHLVLGTQQDNVKDRDDRKRGRWHRGTAHYNCKLTPEMVVRIKMASGYGAITNLAREFGLNPATLHRVRKGQAGVYV